MYSYDAAGRPLGTEHFDCGESYEYDPLGRLIAHIDPLGNRTRALDPGALIGFRGSLAGGLKGPPKLGANMEPVAFDGKFAFKPDRRTGQYIPYRGKQGYDADYFVVSDELAGNPKFYGAGHNQRNVFDLDPTLSRPFDVSHKGMLKDPVLSEMKKDSLEFIIRMHAEHNKLLGKVDPQVYFIK